MRIPLQQENLAWNRLGKDIMVMDLGENREFHELNESAAFIWTQIDGRKDESAIAQELSNAFEVEPDQAQRDVTEILATFEDLRLIKWI